MKTFHRFSLIIGIVLGLVISRSLPYLRDVLAEEPPKGTVTQEELDKKMDEILENQKELKKHIKTIIDQTRFLKASSGR